MQCLQTALEMVGSSECGLSGCTANEGNLKPSYFGFL